MARKKAEKLEYWSALANRIEARVLEFWHFYGMPLHEHKVMPSVMFRDEYMLERDAFKDFVAKRGYVYRLPCPTGSHVLFPIINGQRPTDEEIRNCMIRLAPKRSRILE